MPAERKRGSRSISVSRATGRRITAYAKSHDVSVRALVEAIIAPVLDGDEPIPSSIPEREEWMRHRVIPVGNTPETAAERADRIAKFRDAADARAAHYRTTFLAAATATPTEVRAPPLARLTISAELYEDMAAAVERRAASGLPELSDSELLDSALVRMLDVLETLPKGLICGICINEITGGARQLPLGRDNGLVWVCWGCDTDHPRNGRYSFDGGRSVDQREARGSLSAGDDGHGNRRRGWKR